MASAASNCQERTRQSFPVGESKNDWVERKQKLTEIATAYLINPAEIKDWELEDRCFNVILESYNRNEWNKLNSLREQALKIKNLHGESIFDVYRRDAINFYLNPPENLVFQGGGPKGLAYIGALRVLEERKLLGGIKRVAGTSAGAITAALIAFGYSSDEVYQFLVEKPLTDFLDLAPSCISLCAGTEFLNWINQVIQAKTGILNCTFGELRKKIENGENFKHLHMFSMRVRPTRKASHFGSEDKEWDNLIIADALRASMSLPLVYPPYTLHFKDPLTQLSYPAENFGSFMDGGLSGKLFNLPIDVFDKKKYTQKDCSALAALHDELNTRTLAFSLYTPREPKNDPPINCIVGTYTEWEQCEKKAASIFRKSKEENNQLRIVRISNTQVGTVKGFFENKDKFGELIESGRAATLAFFQEHEENHDRMEAFAKGEKMKFSNPVTTAFYHTFKNNLSQGSILGVEIVGDNISFHTNHIGSYAPLYNPSRDQFSFTKLAALDDRFSIFILIRNSRYEITDSPEKKIGKEEALEQARKLYNQNASFYKKCFHWDIFRKLIIERNISEYIEFFMEQGVSFNTPTLNPLGYAYHCGAFKSFEALLKDPKVNLEIIEPGTNKTLLYYMAKGGQLDLAKAYCEVYKIKHPESYQSLLDHKVNSSSGIKKSALDIALEKRKAKIIDFLIEEGATYQDYYEKYIAGRPVQKMLVGDMDRKLSEEEKLKAFEFCLKKIYKIVCTSPPSGPDFDSDSEYKYDHSEGYNYLERLIRNKIRSGSFENLKTPDGSGLLLNILIHTSNDNPLARGRLTRLVLEGEFKDNVNQINNNGITPLLAVAEHKALSEYDFSEKKERALSSSELKEADMMSYLLDIQGIDVNYQNADGNTALHYAVSRKARRNVQSLLSHKEINPNIQNNSGQTPLHLTQDREIIELLIQAGAKDTLVNDQGIALKEIHGSLKKTDEYKGIFANWFGYYEGIHQSESTLASKITLGTTFTILNIIGFPFIFPIMATIDTVNSIQHATTNDGSQCICRSCDEKRRIAEIKLPALRF